MSNIERQQHPSHFVASQTIREKFRRYRLWRLRTLPAHVYRELIDRLHRGHACFSLAKWVLKLPDRGGMQNVGFWTIWMDIQMLAEEINAKRADSHRSIESLIPQPSGEKSQAADQRNSPLPGSPNKLGRVEDHASEDAKSPSRTGVLQSLFDHNWDALERCRVTEEELADNGLPLHALIPARVRLTRKQLKIVIELRRNEAEELLKQKADERFTAGVSRKKGDAWDQLENPLPDGPDKRSAEDHVTEGVKKLNRRVMVQALFVHNWDALERCRVTEEELADKGLPVQALMHATVRLLLVQSEILTEWGRNDAQEFLKQKVMGSEGFPPPPRSDFAKEELKHILQQFSRKDRVPLRRMLGHG